MRIIPYVVGSIGTNCYLVWDENSLEAMLVDPGDFAVEIMNEINNNGLQLKYLFLTHCHFDHILGVPGFLEAEPDAKLAGGQADEDMMNGHKLDIYLKDGDVLKLGDLSFQVIATPGHTRGGFSLYIDKCDSAHIIGQLAGTVFTGDALFQNSIGRTDLSGGDIDILINSIKEKLLVLPDDTLVLPGHMGASTIGREKEYNPFLK